MTLPAYLDTHTAIVGASGAGKTVTAKNHVEALLAARRHVCIVDPTGAWYGLRSDASGDGPGFDIPIFGGPHGDVQITADQGEAIGAFVAGGVSAIVDVSSLRTGAEQRRFVRDLARRLRAKPDGNFHLVVDEADEFAAQKPRDDYGFDAGEELIWMAKRGRLAGFVLTLITQRPASIDKEVLTQAQTLIIHQLVAPVDQKPIVDYLRDHADKATLATIKGSLAGLGQGERYVYSPRLSLLERGVSPMPATFDSSRTPAPGEMPVEPKMLASIDLGAIREALAGDEASNDAPKASNRTPDDAPAVEIARMNARVAELETERDHWRQRAYDADRLIDQFREAIAAYSPAASQRGTEPVATANAGGGDVDRSAERAPLQQELSDQRRPARGKQLGDGPSASRRRTEGLNAFAMKMLDMLDRIAPARVTWASLAAMVGNKARGGNFNTARKAMRESGLIVEEGDTVRSIKPPSEMMSREQARQLWKSVLTNPAPRMIDALHIRPMMREELGEFLDLVPRGGNWNNGMAQLTRNGVVVDRGGVLHLAEPLPGESA